jgi:hypothetical protein
LASFGLVLGLAALRALSKGLGSLLFGVTAGDPATFAGIALVLIAVSVAWCLLLAEGVARQL